MNIKYQYDENFESYLKTNDTNLWKDKKIILNCQVYDGNNQIDDFNLSANDFIDFFKIKEEYIDWKQLHPYDVLNCMVEQGYLKNFSNIISKDTKIIENKDILQYECPQQEQIPIKSKRGRKPKEISDIIEPVSDIPDKPDIPDVSIQDDLGDIDLGEIEL